MFNIADLPAVRAQLEQDAAAAKGKPVPAEQASTVEYVRAPDGDGHAAALRLQGDQR